MNQISTQVKTHFIEMDDGKEYFITLEEYNKIFELSSARKTDGLWLHREYLKFRNVKRIQEIRQPETTKGILDHFMERTKGAPKAAYEAMLRGFDRAIKESPGSYKLAKKGTLELRKQIVKKIESFA